MYIRCESITYFVPSCRQANDYKNGHLVLGGNPTYHNKPCYSFQNSVL